MSDVRENLTYETFGTAIRELAQTIADDGYEPDVILSIARGGVFVAGGLAYALDCKNIHLVNVEFYTGVGETLEMPVMLRRCRTRSTSPTRRCSSRTTSPTPARR